MINLEKDAWKRLQGALRGDVSTDESARRIYATDASVYRELPMAVAWPDGEDDLRELVHFAGQHGVPLVPRAAGTSLAGQAIGPGLVVDVSRHMRRVLEVDEKERTVWVEPGVVRDELNKKLEPFGLMFAPDTSTSNRATIGGMVGNNSCGSGSIVFGSTRDHVEEIRVVLADGAGASFRETSPGEVAEKCAHDGLEGSLYRWVVDHLQAPDIAEALLVSAARKTIRRRNTGYALDLLLRQQPFASDGPPLDLCALLCGSEGTLAMFSRVKLKLVPVPAGAAALLVVHLRDIEEAARATLVARRHDARAIELLDRLLLQCAAKNAEQRQNQFFIEGDPGALLVIELRKESEAALQEAMQDLKKDLEGNGYGYAYVELRGPEMSAVWNLRKAGLGTLANLSGDAKAVACIEDTAVAVDDLPEYLSEFQGILDRYGKECIYYGHIGDGELHLRPVLDLRRGPDREVFKSLTADVAGLVKRFGGSLSGEHGDGRVRGAFIETVVGSEVYGVFQELKAVWDPRNLFNPGKIVAVPPMDEDLRVGRSGQQRPELDTLLRFSTSGGLVRMAENCNGSGDCRKSHDSGGVMCPSYMATLDERTTTRARANLLRDVILESGGDDPLAREDLYEILDLCLSCKGCKTECPSNVDMALLKAEVQQRHHDVHGAPLRARVFAEYPALMEAMARLPGGRWMMGQPLAKGLTARILGLAPSRAVPELGRESLRRWAHRDLAGLQPQKGDVRGEVIFFADEFTNLHDVGPGIRTLRLLTSLGYRVTVPRHGASGRTHLSKGFVRRARTLAEANVRALRCGSDGGPPIVGLEPSAILSFRDEYPELVSDGLVADARALAARAHTFEEWFVGEARAGRITPDDFGDDEADLLVHAHCHQRAAGRGSVAEEALAVPRGFRPLGSTAGCCGMAGSFGYEAEHYALSMKIGELKLFPAVRAAGETVRVAASGTSCRHQILDGTGVAARHPAEWLFEAREARLARGS